MTTYDIVRPVGDRTTAAAPSRPERLWGAEDVASFLCVPLRTIYQWRYTKYGPRGRRVGRYLRYDPAEVRAWFDGLDDTERG
ncbi:helix-turn-helix transcriptional regulator [Actinomycetospora sp. CA-053990]|uniref:helix-turn-helix transcriptional regulator n=1 Tax=Actinomycetospora sp. CA-053990 TaxID=3239891 RepID=UPI003D90567E